MIASKGRVRLKSNNQEKKMQVSEAFDISTGSSEWADPFPLFLLQGYLRLEVMN